MSAIQENVLLSHLNEDGDRVLEFPITKAECVDGLDEHIKETAFFNGYNCGTLEDIGILEGKEEENGS